MQSRQRNPSDGFRSGGSSRISPDGRHGMYNSGSNYRNYGRGGGGGGGGGFSRGGHQKPPSSYLPPPPPPPPPPRKIDILMEAGRLAAEYLVNKGLLPPKWPNNSRETAAPEGRTSALARLGSSDGSRRYNDEYNSRNNSRGRRRMGPYNGCGGGSSSSRGYGSDYGRENGRNGPWSGCGRGYSESVEGEGDYAPGYRKDRRSEHDEAASSVSRAADERHSKSEVTGESGSEVGTHEMADDSGSKASSSSTRKEAQLEVDVELDKVVDNAGVVNSEKRYEGKSEASGDLKKQSVSAEEFGGRPCEAEGEPVSADGKDLLKLCSFKKVPTRPRSALLQRNTKIDQGLPTEVRNPVEDTSLGVEKVAQGERPVGESLSDSHKSQTETLELQAPETSHIVSVQPVEESLKKHESNLSPPGFGSSEQLVEVSKEITQREGIKRQREPSSENENSRPHNLRAKQSSPAVDSIQVDEEMVTAVAVDQEKQGSAALFPKIEPELNLQMEGDKQILPGSFKICDLNLMGTPEITEIPDDPVMDHLHTSTLETGNELAVDFALSIGKNANDSNDYSRLSDDDKVVPIIDLEEDSPIEGGDCDPSKPKNETIYSSLDDFMTHEENADLPVMQDGYLTISEYLHNDISACPPVSPDLNNLQTGMSLDNGEGVNGDDDSIYVSLGEIPIGFMEVWDQPPQDYGKFF